MAQARAIKEGEEEEEEDIVLQEYHSEDENKHKPELVYIIPSSVYCMYIQCECCVMYMCICRSDTEDEIEEEYVRKVNHIHIQLNNISMCHSPSHAFMYI